MKVKKEIEIEIFGNSYLITTDEDEERIKEAVEFLKKKLNELSSKNTSQLNIALFVGLLLSNEIFKIKERLEKLYELINQV